MSSYRQIFKSTGLLGSVQVLSVLTAVIRNKIAALIIGAEGIGLSDLYLRTVDLLGNATNFGLGMSAVRLLAEKYAAGGDSPLRAGRLVRLIRTWVMLTAALGTAATLLLAPLLSLLTTGTLQHTAAYACLSVAVGSATLTGGEAAILKATRRLRRLAWASACTMLVVLVLSAGLYLWLGMRGIVPLLTLGGLTALAFHLRQTRRDYPYSLGPLRTRFLRRGGPMLRLGTAYILAGVATAGAEMLVRAAIRAGEGGLRAVGLYAAGYTLTAGYARIVLVAMDADYFPRLSSAVADTREMNLTINRQINTLVVLMAPFLLLFCLCLPLVVRVLYTGEFMKIMPMVLPAALHMYFKAVYTPIAYIPLARGDSFLYMTMEVVYDVQFCACVVLGYHTAGLMGAGLGLAVANLIDMVCVAGVYSAHYHYRMNRSTLRSVALLFILLCVGLMIATQRSVPFRAIGGAGVLLLMLPTLWSVMRKVRR